MVNGKLTFVSLISGGLIRVNVQNDKFIEALESLRFQYNPEWNEWFMNICEEDKPRLLESLRNFGIAFSDAPAGWPPAAVFEYYRELGKLSGQYVSVIWSGKGEYKTTLK